ncbi:hypothetical protein OROGR_021465 [Orobanche gracilis]
MFLMTNELLGSKERWIQQYSSGHNILLVGEGDFSFSLSLGMAFGSATNIVATTLDSYDGLINKYKNARANVAILRSLGATISYGVDATNMADLPDLRWKKFDRIIYNFPHAGFHLQESNPQLIRMHRNLVRGFLENASSLLWTDGEVHINHKITEPFNSWRIEDIASECSLLYVGRDRLEMKNYPWYRNKRGSGCRPDESFPLGACRTFKFKARRRAQENRGRRSKRCPSPLAFRDVDACTYGYTHEYRTRRYEDRRHRGEERFVVRRSVLTRLSVGRRRRGLLITLA